MKELPYLVFVKVGGKTEVFGFPTPEDQEAFCKECDRLGKKWLKATATVNNPQ